MFGRNTKVVGVSSLPTLVGENRTVWSSSHIDKEYERINTSSMPGYITFKTQ